MKNRCSWLFFVFFLLIFTACARNTAIPTPEEPISPPITLPMDDPRVVALRELLDQSISGRDDVVTFLVYDVAINKVELSRDGKTALVWLALLDKDTQEIIPAEAGLAIARLVSGDGSQMENWDFTLQVDKQWAKVLKSVPDGLLSDELKSRYSSAIQSIKKGHQVFSGYKLPWPVGRTVRLTGSIGHVLTYKTCPDTCLYAFDFADGTEFPVHAAKGGRVKEAVWRYPNGFHEHANYLVIEDTTTSPTTYQVYYHLAQDSIPVALRTRGAPVVQGQYIANADNTGPSTGHHLHFMVHTNSYSYWGTSVDIIFEDVSINGGRPRTCVEASNFPGYGSQCVTNDRFVSGNTGDKTPPTGTISSPKANTVINAAKMVVSGSASDDTGIAFIQLLISTDGNWTTIGPQIRTPTFKVELDLCQANVQPGPFLISMQIVDQSGRSATGTPGQRVLDMQFVCNPPTATSLPTATPMPTPTPTPRVCEPGPEQVAIYSERDFQGECQILEMAKYPDSQAFNPVLDNDIKSIKVGSQAMVLMYADANYQGTQSVFFENDADLRDTDLDENTASSLVVQTRIKVPAAPEVLDPQTQLGHYPSDEEDLTLQWKTVEGASEYSAELNGPGLFKKELDWQSENTWSVGKLGQGDYKLTVIARNLAGESSTEIQFTVVKIRRTPVTEIEALPDFTNSTAFLLKWKVTSGEKDVDHFEIQFNKDDAGWLDWKVPLSSELRQAWFLGELGHTYQFRMRSVDIVGDAAPYPSEAETMVKVQKDCFDDAFENAKPGDDLLDGAAPLEVDHSQEHNFCGYGDMDWVVFPARQGVRYRISTTPLGGNAAASITLYSADASIELGQSLPSEYNTPVELEWVAPQDGLYSIRVSPLHNRLAGSDVRFRLRVDRVLPIKPGSVMLTSLLLPLVWAVFKFYAKIRDKYAQFG